MDDDYELQGYVESSEYRFAVLQSLAESGPLTPTKLSDRTGLRQSHVSRTLTDLRGKGLVRLMVPDEQTKGRLYDITESARELLPKISGIVWQGHEYDIPEPYDRIVARLQERYGEWLVGIGYFDGTNIGEYYFREKEQREISEAEFLDLVHILVNEFSHSETHAGSFVGDLSYEIQVFSGVIRVVLYDAEGYLSIGLDPEASSELPSFFQECKELMD